VTRRRLIATFMQIRQAGAVSLCLFVFIAVPAQTQHAPSSSAAVADQAVGQKSTPGVQSPEKSKEEQDPNEAYKHSSVVKLLGTKLGMSTDQAATAFEVTNFVVLAALVGWLLVRVLPKIFRDRTSSIQKRLVDARAATEEANARLSGVESRLSRLDGQLASLKSQAESDLAVEEVRVRAAIEDEKHKILAAAEQEIAAATAHARRQIQQYAAELAVDQAAKKLVVSAETDRLLVQEFASRLSGKRGEEN
jgi:F-type H+-transporting ATPase subunit b